jgi:hypothetical protein
VDRHAIVTPAQIAEKALQRFRSKYTDAASVLSEAKSLVRDCAKSVVDAQCADLEKRLAGALNTRRGLIALSSWWIAASGPVALSAASVAILTAPIQADFRVSGDTTAPSRVARSVRPVDQG